MHPSQVSQDDTGAAPLQSGPGFPPFPLPVHARPLDPGRLKIIVTGTPKTGNTWIRHLLAALYELPMVELNDFRAMNWPELGPRWIGQQHYYAQRDLLEWGRTEGVVFVTPVRHPGDVLVSLRHHMQNMGSSALTDPYHSMLLDPPDVYGEHTLRFVQTGFFSLLQLSLDWLRGGWAYPVRYEDLWQSPLETLRALTDQFLPMPARRVRQAVCACEPDLMQSTFAADRNFVRKGGTGSWREVLPAGIQAVLAKSEPYPAQFASLNYSMDATHPANTRRREPATVQHALSSRSTFANGVPFAPILIRAYFGLPDDLMARWPDATLTGEDSFFAWLNRPAASDPHAGRMTPVVTELACYLRSLRPDVAEAFRDPFGADRVKFTQWFLHNAVREYKFDPSFTLPVVRLRAEGSSPPE
jgi:hypothetical protein